MVPRPDGLCPVPSRPSGGRPAGEDELVLTALRDGAAGFLLRDSPPGDLVDAVRLARLTAREREVAESVAAGLTNAEIAEALHMGVATVKTHVGNLFAQLEVTNRVQVGRVRHDASST